VPRHTSDGRQYVQAPRDPTSLNSDGSSDGLHKVLLAKRTACFMLGQSKRITSNSLSGVLDFEIMPARYYCEFEKILAGEKVPKMPLKMLGEGETPAYNDFVDKCISNTQLRLQKEEVDEWVLFPWRPG